MAVTTAMTPTAVASLTKASDYDCGWDYGDGSDCHYGPDYEYDSECSSDPDYDCDYSYGSDHG